MGILMLYDMVDLKVARFIGAPTCGNNRLDLKNLHMDSLNIGNSFSTGRTISNNFGLVLGLALKNDLAPPRLLLIVFSVKMTVFGRNEC